MVCELEDEDNGLFNDMRLLPGSCVDPFISYEYQDEDGSFITMYDTDNLHLGIANMYWRFL